MHAPGESPTLYALIQCKWNFFRAKDWESPNIVWRWNFPTYIIVYHCLSAFLYLDSIPIWTGSDQLTNENKKKLNIELDRTPRVWSLVLLNNATETRVDRVGRWVECNTRCHVERQTMLSTVETLIINRKRDIIKSYV